MISLGKWLNRIYTQRALCTTGQEIGKTYYWNPSDDWDPAGSNAAKYDVRPQSKEDERATGFARLGEIAINVLEQQPLVTDMEPELEDAQFWLPIWNRKYKAHQGKVLLSIQCVPFESVERLPAGSGRKKPNSNPELPKPVGRLSLKLNPFSMLRDIMGDKYYGRTCCCLFMILFIVIAYYMVPVIFANFITDSVAEGVEDATNAGNDNQ